MKQETKEETLLNLKTVSELFGLSFFIPAYQRGYRWTESQVEGLLNDINEFAKNKEIENNSYDNVPQLMPIVVEFNETKYTYEVINKDIDEFYCLQPVAVKKKDKGVYEVIDGQQRLTTLYILLKYLEIKSVKQKEKEVNLYSIMYETRQGSSDFLSNITSSEKNEINKNIDFHFMAEAFETIEKWFNKDNISKNFVDILLNNVKVIWYEVDNSSDAYDIFSRLNSGKIPLTNAELVKALLLQASNFKSNEANFKKIQIASEWDTIEKTLQDDTFWFFISNDTKKDDNRIDYILELVAQKTNKNNEYQTFIHFDEVHKGINGKEQKNAETIWKDIKNCFAILEEWYHDHTLYHYIGYLINNGFGINALFELHENSVSKRAFLDKIKDKIKENLNCIAMTKNDIAYSDEKNIFITKRDLLNQYKKAKKSCAEIRKNYKGKYFQISDKNKDMPVSYEIDKDKIKKVLLLFNIESILKSEETYIRFPFNLYKNEKNGWDIEHIASQTDKLPEKDNEKEKWLKQINEYFNTIKLEESVEKIKELLTIKDDNFEELFTEVSKYFNQKNIDFKHNLGNLTLLNPDINRAYGNALFHEKREEIIARDIAGKFIPLTTKNVFLKYYSKEDVANITSWTANDAKEYENTICKVLKDFLS